MPPQTAPPRPLRTEEIADIAFAAVHRLRHIDGYRHMAERYPADRDTLEMVGHLVKHPDQTVKDLDFYTHQDAAGKRRLDLVQSIVDQLRPPSAER